MRESLLTFDKVREIVAQQFGGPVAREGWGMTVRSP